MEFEGLSPTRVKKEKLKEEEEEERGEEKYND